MRMFRTLLPISLGPYSAQDPWFRGLGPVLSRYPWVSVGSITEMGISLYGLVPIIRRSKYSLLFEKRFLKGPIILIQGAPYY